MSIHDSISRHCQEHVLPGGQGSKYHHVAKEMPMIMRNLTSPDCQEYVLRGDQGCIAMLQKKYNDLSSHDCQDHVFLGDQGAKYYHVTEEAIMLMHNSTIQSTVKMMPPGDQGSKYYHAAKYITVLLHDLTTHKFWRPRF